MRPHTYIFTILILLLISSAMGILIMEAKNEPMPPQNTQGVNAISTPEETDVAPTPPAEETSVKEQSMITVSTLVPNTKITSPLQVTGSARGNWYFEASFPIRLVDTNGNTILQTHAEAQGEWMTENFVPFTATLTWSSTSTTATSGVLILMRDNPSGLPEHDAQIEIPVTL